MYSPHVSDKDTNTHSFFAESAQETCDTSAQQPRLNSTALVGDISAPKTVATLSSGLNINLPKEKHISTQFLELTLTNNDLSQLHIPAVVTQTYFRHSGWIMN